MNDVDLKAQIQEMGKRARAAALKLAKLSKDEKNEILESMACALTANEEAICEANVLDLAAAELKGLSSAMIDRLRLNSERVAAMVNGIRQVISLTDPVGEVLSEWTRPNGLRITKKRVPIGVIGIIYESRPNVTCDAAILCFKSGNATILRGGSEAIHSNLAIADVLQRGGKEAGMPDDALQFIPFTDRAGVRHLAEMETYLDLIIPRGGKGLVETVVSLARMPVIKHYDGVCHIFVDTTADLEMATRVVVNAKCQKPSVCNALETLLVHQDVAKTFYPAVAMALQERGVELRGDATAASILGSDIVQATEEDWSTEYLDLTLSMKTVANVDEAIDHINHYGSRHSDSIITSDTSIAERFLNEIDSAAVFWNASTRFNDGEEFGFGAEIGISTDKLHARGPMALPELTSYKYQIIGTGQIR